MKRAFLLEMTIFRDYARQLVGLGLFVSLCIGLGMQTPLAMPATLTCMFFMMSAMGLAAYDQLNHWELFRLTLPLSRRDVVLGRYAAIVTFGLLGMVVGLVAALAATVVVSAVGLPGEVGEAFAFDPDMLGVMAVVTCFTLLIGAVVASVVTPLYFRLGQTRATQILPTVIVLLFVVPVCARGARHAGRHGRGLRGPCRPVRRGACNLRRRLAQALREARALELARRTGVPRYGLRKHRPGCPRRAMARPRLRALSLIGLERACPSRQQTSWKPHAHGSSHGVCPLPTLSCAS